MRASVVAVTRVPSASTRRQRLTCQSRELSPDVAARLTRIVNDLCAAAGQPRHEVLDAIIAVALDHMDEIEIRLARQRLDVAIATLPADTRPVPDLTAYDQLLSRQGLRVRQL